jgi:hypothetical protein
MSYTHTMINFPRHRLLGLCLLACLLFGAAKPTLAEQADWAVLELFTSQSCGSCPPATELLRELSQRPGIIALSWSVDYWDHLGWKDTLAKPSFSGRQRLYNQKLGKPGIFTPQLVIGGQSDVIGSKRDLIEAVLAQPGIKAQALGMTISDADVSFSLPATAGVNAGIVTLIHFKNDVDVPVTAGENKGKTLRYQHAVTAAQQIEPWDGTAKQITISREQFCDEGNAVLVQDAEGGSILFAAVIIDGQAL